MMKHSEEFKREAVRIALTSGLSRERVAKDLGIGKSTLGKWLALREELQEDRLAVRAKAQREAIGNLKPLTEQITELMLSLPPAQRARPWSIVDLQGQLKGRYKERPSLGNLGEALRALGWTRHRDWRNRGGGRRIWVSKR